MTKRTCSVEDCTDPHYGRGFCKLHYDHWRAHGDPFGGKRHNHGGFIARLLERVVVNGECWEWTGEHSKTGYSRIMWKGRKRAAHRCTYAYFIGPIPDGLEVDHLCRNRGCIRPDHMELVTHTENIRRSEPAQRTHCPAGHAYSGDNLYAHPETGRRVCRACTAAARVRYEKRMADAGLKRVGRGANRRWEWQ